MKLIKWHINNHIGNVNVSTCWRWNHDEFFQLFIFKRQCPFYLYHTNAWKGKKSSKFFLHSLSTTYNELCEREHKKILNYLFSVKIPSGEKTQYELRGKEVIVDMRVYRVLRKLSGGEVKVEKETRKIRGVTSQLRGRASHIYLLKGDHGKVLEKPAGSSSSMGLAATYVVTGQPWQWGSSVSMRKKVDLDRAEGSADNTLIEAGASVLPKECHKMSSCSQL